MAKKLGSKDKHIILSGGSRGLGLAIIESLLEKGYRISSFSRENTRPAKELANRYKKRMFFREVDIRNSKDLSSFIGKAIEENGHIYGVINNAAIAVDGILATLPEIEISRMLSINLEGTLRLTRLCLRDIISFEANERCGRIINISSIISARGYNGLVVYSATKAALDGITRSLAREVGRAGITVNSIAPGYIRTEMSASLSEQKIHQIIRRTPLGRLAELDDIIPIVDFLISDAARMITGQTIIVDGGISV